MPSTIEQVHREYRARGLTVLAINIQEDAATVKAWADEKKVTVPIVLDESGAVTRQWGVTATPTAFVLGRDRRVVGKAIGTKEWTSERGRALLGALLGP
ncbi:MAG: TlpA family protein disulfide reductase [Candidatus Rokubacteria bacterium]|nr:TlpA family protein disulfide reductase [Candidatus Rokubacteria bacterium]